MTIELGDNVEISPEAEIHVEGTLTIGDDSKVSAGCVIEGRDITIGRGFWMLPGAVIGGGSAFELQSQLIAGDFLHMGRNTLINTARKVVLGDEVGLGTGTMIFTHGAYLSALDGFPVSFAPVFIGSRVWLPGAVVNPGVAIGNDVVVGVGSIVTRSIPSGALAMGVPAKVVQENAYPRPISLDDFWIRFLRDFEEMGEDPSLIAVQPGRRILAVGDTIFDTQRQVISGPVTNATERVRDQLRRYGVRFYSRPQDGEYWSWR
jgi:acetyltransferase-like isoleucine patch superfamily enzyme